MNTQEFSPIAYDLLAYLLEHPNAQDTLEGIVEWWALEQAIQRWTAQVTASLAELTVAGLISERRGADGRAFFRLNQARLPEIRLLLTERAAPG